jgi:hypothetical protein
VVAVAAVVCMLDPSPPSSSIREPSQFVQELEGETHKKEKKKRKKREKKAVHVKRVPSYYM